MRGSTIALFVTAGMACTASGQVLGLDRFIARSLDAAPGTPLFYAGSNGFGQAFADDTGRVYYYGVLLGATTLDRDGIWHATTSADNTKLIRSNDPFAALGGDIVFARTATGGGLSTSNMRPMGTGVIFGATFRGTGVTVGVNDSGVFTGTPAGYTMFLRRGDAAVGTAGAVINTDLRGQSQQNTAVNKNGYFASLMTVSGGDTVGTTNDKVIYGGMPGSLAVIAREADALDAGLTLTAMGFNAKLNGNDQTFYDVTLGGAGVSTANDSAWYMHTPGSGAVRIYREGDLAPGTAGADFSGQAGTGSRSYTANGMSFSGTLRNGDTITGVNDQALFITNAGGMSMVVRKGDPATGTDANFNGFNINSVQHSNAGVLSFQGFLIGGSTDTTNDSGLWFGTAGDLRLIAREGQPAPRTAGAVLGNTFNGIGYARSGSDLILYAMDLTGGDTTIDNSTGLYLWSERSGLRMLFRKGDLIEIAPGVTKTIVQWTIQPGDNGNGGCMAVNDQGIVAMRLVFTDNSDSLVRMRVSDCAADFNFDGSLDFFDYDDFVSAFEASTVSSDFNQDNSIDFFDYDDFVIAFEAGCDA
jgi:hypothetical protein